MSGLAQTVVRRQDLLRDAVSYFLLISNRTKLKIEKQMTPLPDGSCPAVKARSHVCLQHVLITSGRGTRYDGMADLVTDGTFRRPIGCLLAGHTRYTRNTCFSSAFTSDMLTRHLHQVLLCTNMHSLGIWQSSSYT